MMLLRGLPQRQLVSTQTFTTHSCHIALQIFTMSQLSITLLKPRDAWHTQHNHPCPIDSHRALELLQQSVSLQHRFMSYILVPKEARLFLNSPLEPLLEDSQVFLQSSDLLPLDPCDITISVHVPEQRRDFPMKLISVSHVLHMRTSLTCPCRALGGTPACYGSSQVGPKPG